VGDDAGMIDDHMGLKFSSRQKASSELESPIGLVNIIEFRLKRCIWLNAEVNGQMVKPLFVFLSPGSTDLAMEKSVGDLARL